MKKTAILINTSRGEIINENDLVQALEQGLIAGAGIDVFSKEHYSGPLLKFDNQCRDLKLVHLISALKIPVLMLVQEILAVFHHQKEFQ